MEECDLCGRKLKITNVIGVCQATPECRREYGRRWQAALPARPGVAAARSRYTAAYWKANGERIRATWRENQARREAELRAALAAEQGGGCPWCSLPLPGDLAGTQFDHVIPLARGGPDERWNVQLLHADCNQEKRSKITARALELAAEHGIVIGGPPGHRRRSRSYPAA